MSAPPEPPLRDALRPLTSAPGDAAIFCDIDGTLAPIVGRPEESRVGEKASTLLAELARSYGSVACVSGRPVAEARRLVGVDAIAYVGSHGAEILDAGAEQPELVEGFHEWEDRVRGFVERRARDPALQRAEVRLEDKGPIKALHWRGTPDEDAARSVLEEVAAEARSEGLDIHWGRKVLEIRPPVVVDKGQALATLLERGPASAVLYGGDDVTDLDAFDALERLVAAGTIRAAVRVGVRSSDGPATIVDRADVVVEGVDGFVEVLAVLADALR